jgi:hypothetical protein
MKEEGTLTFFRKARRRHRKEGRPRFGLKDNMKMNMRKIRWGDLDWINLVPDT